MAIKKHIMLLKNGVEGWNEWKEENPDKIPDLTKADLHEANLAGADLSGADLSGANLNHANLAGATLYGAYLRDANLTGADLGGANLIVARLPLANLNYANLSSAELGGAFLTMADFSYARLKKADLTLAKLRGANLRWADLREANLSGADFSKANLSKALLLNANLNNAVLVQVNLREAALDRASLVGTNLDHACLDGSSVYGASVWDVSLDETCQRDLVITPQDQDIVTVDNLKVAQFIYLLLNNEEIRNVIDTITSKAVLILGRFTKKRRKALDAMRDELRKRGYLPILFDFDKPTSRDLTETISTLAHMARFVIADITDAKAVPVELQKFVPSLPSLPVQPIILKDQEEYGLFEHIRRFPWVLKPFSYRDTKHLRKFLEEKVIDPAAKESEKIDRERTAIDEKRVK